MRNECTAIVLDFESTGLLNHVSAKPETQPRITEIGALLCSESRGIIETYNQLVNPHRSLTPKITKITGLTDADLEQEPDLIEALPPLRAMFERADMLFTHNLPFDRGLLELELKRIGADPWPWTKVNICTVQEYTELWGRRPKLIQLYEEILGKPLAQTHRALDDALALWEIIDNEKIISKYAAIAR